MKHILIVVDMQKDFIDGALGTPEAQAMVENAVEKIKTFEGEIFVTLDTHEENYLSTQEGRKLPVKHCIRSTDGWQLDARIAAALQDKRHTIIEKPGFGSRNLPGAIAAAIGPDVPHNEISLELIGLCTDICVVSNALILKAAFPEAAMRVDSSCCAGVSPQTHAAALSTMACCQIEIL